MPGPKRSERLAKFGHAGGHLREALVDALEFGDQWWKHVEIDFNHERHNRWWNRLSEKSRAKWLLGQLWNCTDVLPSLAWSELTDRDPWGETKHRHTYGTLARVLSRELRDVESAVA